jgi:hypothetical protein
MTNNQNQTEQTEILEAQESLMAHALRWSKIIVATNGSAVGISVGLIALGLASAWWLVPTALCAFIALAFHEAGDQLRSGRWDEVILKTATELVRAARK